MSELSAIELESRLRDRALDYSIRSFGSYINSTPTKEISKRARKFFDFLSGQDVNGVIPEGDDALKDFVEVQAPGYDSTNEFRLFNSGRRLGEPILDWFKRTIPAGGEYPIISTGDAIDLIVAVAQDPELEVEIFQNPGQKRGWSISALSRVL